MPPGEQWYILFRSIFSFLIAKSSPIQKANTRLVRVALKILVVNVVTLCLQPNTESNKKIRKKDDNF